MQRRQTAQTPDSELAPKDYDRLQESLSALRTEMTRDLLSRERRVLRLFTDTRSAWVM